MNITKSSIILDSEKATKNLANRLAQSLQGNEIILLKGDLGTGKTFFTRELIKFFCGANINVTSPTFNILQIYNAANFNIYHYDLYRLKDQGELFELAFEQAMHNNICLIEWPEIAMDFITSPFIEISFEIADQASPNARLCSINIF